MPRSKYKIGTIDFETDPFQYGTDIAPFCGGVYNGVEYRDFWGDDCHIQLVEYLHTIKEAHYYFAHNGGRF